MSPDLVRRVAFRRKPRRNRALDRAGWEKLYPEVIALDVQAICKAAEDRGMLPVRMRGTTIEIGPQQIRVCPAWVMDPSVWGTCSGPWRLDHVKSEPKIGVKGDDDIWHLVALCVTHDERGARAGYQWNTAHREEERGYLAAHRPRPD